MTTAPDTTTDGLAADQASDLALALAQLRTEVRDTIVAFCAPRPLRELSAPNVAGALADDVMGKVSPGVTAVWQSADRFERLQREWREEARRQRVALVAVLDLPDNTTFDEAVDAAGVLAGQQSGGVTA